MRGKSTSKPGRLLPVLFWLSIAGMAVFVLMCEHFASIFFFFTGGWTNGWPGLSYQTVLAAGVTVQMARHARPLADLRAIQV